MVALPSDLGRQKPHIRLLVLLAKIRLSESERAAARTLLDAVDDWDTFADMAARNFSLPLVRWHLADMDRSAVPPAFWQRIEEDARTVAFRNLHMISVQKAFREACLDPLGLQGLFFKGVNMAAQFYPNLGLRPCRDVDVLVPQGTLGRVLRRAIAAGYVPVSPDAHVIPMTSERDIRAILRYGGSATLISPDRIVIDLQDHLDKHSGIFAGYDVFGHADSYAMGDTRFATLPAAFLLNYLGHHHTRHLWARLHWLSDLDAILSAPGFDRDAALALADALGQRGTVEASLELHALMSTDTPWDEGPDLARGKAFLRLAIGNLPGELALEKQLGINMVGGEFMFPWQARPELIERARRGWWRSIFRPTLSQYARRPLPEALQWLYYLPRALELVHLRRERLRAARK